MRKIIELCVIGKLNVLDKTILVKNRDRGYLVLFVIVHLIVKGTEIVYIQDVVTDWSLGMNLYGIGIVSASLLVNADLKLGRKDKDKFKLPTKSLDGKKIRACLPLKSLSLVIRKAIVVYGDSSRGITGHTFICNPKHSFAIELTTLHIPVIKKLNTKKVVIRTNHGIQYKDAGYISGRKKKSSVSRMEIAKKYLSKVKKISLVMDVLAKKYTDDPFLNPYRKKLKDQPLRTTTQIMYNLDDKEFHVRYDVDNCEFKGYKNKLPKGYKPKIKVIVGKTKKF